MDDFLKGFLEANAFVDDPATRWVEWEHISKGRTHCEPCLKLDRRWFLKAKTPKVPQHPHCHCVTRAIPYDVVVNHAEAKSDYSKFDPYLFDIDQKYKHGKNKAFESWGYTVEDAEWLQKEIEEQAQYKYISGEYSLGKLNENGQRINIRIELDRKNGAGRVSFISGWMLYPDGQIRLTTPYGGK